MIFMFLHAFLQVLGFLQYARILIDSCWKKKKLLKVLE